MTFGHETAGEVAVLGEDVTGPARETASSSRPVRSATEPPARGGGEHRRRLAEYTVAAAEVVVPLPPGIPFEQA
ncbi:hypothetical protein [Streptomyces erythrochromogenes]|uniref:hypothetical protein n=1 Tax=Streptomyces erythrochromogenes TaxID=285574 RepID=UPI0004CD8DF4|nr:hypothetical protein [Streptomyces erythrochromogenes]